ncbi:hypothetical protein [uncultured Candidatus Kuenenia sp.]|uniref:hypothetical protein n=1 Tax=uncultured Candidatus Kuenenia sp. TaxID=1048336 RepID=UPI0025DB70F4|nr:hypothetical protein [uncultured Candidatus Kuenenia sp.]
MPDISCRNSNYIIVTTKTAINIKEKGKGTWLGELGRIEIISGGALAAGEGRVVAGTAAIITVGAVTGYH